MSCVPLSLDPCFCCTALGNAQIDSEADLPALSGYLYSSKLRLKNTSKKVCSFSPEKETVTLEIGLRGKKGCNWAMFLFLSQAARVRNLTPKPVTILDWSECNIGRHIGSKIFGTLHCFLTFQSPGRDY